MEKVSTPIPTAIIAVVAFLLAIGVWLIIDMSLSLSQCTWRTSGAAVSAPAASVVASTSVIRQLANPLGTFEIDAHIAASATNATNPIVEITGYANALKQRFMITTKWSGVFIPNSPVVATLRLPVVNTLASTQSFIYLTLTSVPVSRTPPVEFAGSTAAVIGLGPNSSQNPLFAALVAAGLSQQLAFRRNGSNVGIALCTRLSPEFNWCWTNFDAPALKSGLYQVALQPTVDAPWYRATLSLGNWISTVPTPEPIGSASSAIAVVADAAAQVAESIPSFISPLSLYFWQPQNGQACSLMLQAGVAIQSSAFKTVQIGMSAGTVNTIFVIDNTRGMFGVALS